MAREMTNVQRSTLPLLVAFILAVGSLTAVPRAGRCEDVGVGKAHHPWGQFKPGAWKVVRVVAESLDEKGVVTSTSSTETKTTLLKVEKDGITLGIEVEVEVAGKIFRPEPRTVKQSFYGEMVCLDLKIV